MQVILLSRILERLEGVEARLMRVEEKIAGRADNVAKSARQEDEKKFEDYIKAPENAEKIMERLHGWIDGKRKVKALVYIRAAMDARVLARPPFVVAEAEFPGCLGSKSLYYVYTSEPVAFASEEDLQELKKATAELAMLRG